MANCSVCNQSISIFESMNAKTCVDGKVCQKCAAVSPEIKFRTAEQIREYIQINESRKQNFKPVVKIKTPALLMSLGIIFDVDPENKKFTIPSRNLKDVVVYTFDELEGYDIKEGDKTYVSKRKGGITRGIIGGAIAGPAGAVVGAGSGKTKTKVVKGQEQIEIMINSVYGKFPITFIHSQDAASFIDACLLESSDSDSADKTIPQSSVADELLKLKSLLDAEILTQEEFEIQKQKLLS